MRRRQLQGLWLVSTAALLAAADAPWITKPPAQWTEADARQVLTTSPWVRGFTAGVVRRLGEDELREAGQMGQQHGVGYDGVDPKGSGPKLTPNIFTGGGGEDRSPRSLPRAITLRLRWESALPIRVAQLRAHESELPTLEGDGYRIAVYGVPGVNFKGDPKQLGDPLKKEAALKRAGKKDVKPRRVEVFQRDDGLAVAYLFPLSAEITKANGRVEFEAHIGRIIVSQSFDLTEMMFQGKLEL
jgi:hypothetical protein